MSSFGAYECSSRCERQQAQKNNKPNFASSTCMLSIEKLEMGRG
jgi:hypothetical protein